MLNKKNSLFAALAVLVFSFPASAADEFVDIQNFAFSPQSVTINVGDKVTWTNLDTIFHTSTSTTGVWNSGTLSNMQSFAFTFLVPPGSYEYVCTLHPFMLPGKVVVEGCFLESDVDFVPAQTGGTVNFKLQAGAGNAGRNYIMLGSVTGTSPGFPLPGGLAVMPLNWDPFTDLVLAFLNTPIFSSFLGGLDATGAAAAQLNAPPLPPAAVGLIMDFAYALNKPFDCASNPVSIRII